MSTLFDQNERTRFHDKAWKRAEMHAWDARWPRLSGSARRALLDTVRVRSQRSSSAPVNSISSLDPSSLVELQREGFVEVTPAGFVLAEAALGFVHRVRALRRFALLDPHQPTQFDRYLSMAFASFDLGTVVASVVERQTGQKRWDFPGDIFDLYVRQAGWPEWAAEFLALPAALALVEAIDRAGPAVSVERLAALVPEQHPSAVRAAYDALVNHLALVEDIDPNTLDLIAGFLPVVREERAGLLERKPAALEQADPAELGPEGGIDVPDLRAVLLEVSAGHPQLKQNESLFAKEEARFLAALDPLPAWFPLGDELDRPHRLRGALFLASALGFTRSRKVTDKSIELTLTPDGQLWLAEDREAQYDRLFDQLRDCTTCALHPYAQADSAFLASAVRASSRRKGLRPFHIKMTAEERQPLRQAIHGLFGRLPADKFVSVDSFLDWAGEPERNPLLLGLPAREVVVQFAYTPVPALDGKLAEVCKQALNELLRQRLIPLGCVRLGRDAAGERLFARTPRLDAYFGVKTSRRAEATPPSRVIVQPDFTVVVIGLDHTPVAELAPFCDRIQGRSAQGATTLRLSRESIFRGLATGLRPADVVDRLKKLAGQTIPANVLTEVTGWCEKVRSVKASTTTLIRCPDPETAARVAGALGKSGERVGEAAVAYAGKLTVAIRQKLQSHGVLVADEPKKPK